MFSLTWFYANESFWLNLFISFILIMTGIVAASFLYFDKEDYEMIKTTILKSENTRIDMDEFTDYFHMLHKNLIGGRKTMSLEKEIMHIPNLYVRNAFTLLIKPKEKESTFTLLRISNTEYKRKQDKLSKLFEKVGNFAITWGILGTLIGLFLKVGIFPTTALTLVAILGLGLPILFGLLFNFFLCKPLAQHTKTITNKEMNKRETIISLISGVLLNESPTVLKALLGDFTNVKIERSLDEIGLNYDQYERKKEQLEDLLQDDMQEVLKIILENKNKKDFKNTTS